MALITNCQPGFEAIKENKRRFTLKNVKNTNPFHVILHVNSSGNFLLMHFGLFSFG
jgi:hypothetical protein